MILYGGDYNPEQWPREVWAEDAKLMRDAGVNFVTLGIFAWAQVEPVPGDYRFAWLDEVMDLLHENGVAVCLATMTASPPPWLGHRNPESLPVDDGGVRLSYGSRCHVCPSSTAYREAARALVTELVRRYADHPALAAWHIGNEYGCQVPKCYCDLCAEAFRGWLRRRYDTLDGLNEAWTTTFWSQRYSAWEEILPPRRTTGIPNPAHTLDFTAFCSDALLECYRLEADVVRQATPGVPVTTNLCNVAPTTDYPAWAAEMDVVSGDCYPDQREPEPQLQSALFFDVWRGLGDGRPWWLLEQATSAVNWMGTNPAKKPGGMRLDSLQAVARGADAVLFFQWRASRGGAEKFHSAMVPHAGPDHPLHQAVRDLGADLRSLGAVEGSRVRAETALVLDWRSWWAVEQESHPSDRIRMMDRLRDHHDPLWRLGVTTDVVRSTSDLSGYRLVVVPNLYLLTAEAAANLAAYVERGGHLVVSFFSGIVDENDRVWLGGYPGPLRELLGLSITEFDPLHTGTTVPITWDGAESRATLWSERIELEGAEAVAAFGDGSPAVTRHAYGEGVAWYLGTRPDPAVMRELTRRIAAEAGVTLPGLPEGVEAVTRAGADGVHHLFLLNHTFEEHRVPVADGGSVLLDGERSGGALVLPPRAAAVLRRAGGDAGFPGPSTTVSS
ncbi:beta-galactosidase [Nonomuraea longispora]|uniref:Beta-galactosidase n=1 Tax=Nonomuraea longispora TaxID=1848320 RepID=A0A4R4NHB6_9ACTN|nr:beta-galactosidase [Nonomuraea longispora]TDC08425.1 beta-galactosidase [Nonomuraea longispora]